MEQHKAMIIGDELIRSHHSTLTIKDEDASSSKVYRWCDLNVFEKSNAGCLGFLKSRSRKNNNNAAHILNNVYGEACPGELLAIMGSSGAGKTTLLNALTFNTSTGQVVKGTRWLGEKLVNARILSPLYGYVHQEDLFLANITVREHLIFQALLRLERKVPYKRKLARVDEVISELRLNKCKDTPIGEPETLKGISGGERKRLSFASEILTDPQLLFCDEPTSGLDSFTAKMIVQTMQGLAQKKKTIVCTIHQPSSDIYGTFDKLLLMADGQVSFLGTIDQASEFFSKIGHPCPINHNPADFYIKILSIIPSQEETSRKNVKQICESFVQTENSQRLQHRDKIFQKRSNFIIDDFSLEDLNFRSSYKASWFTQFIAVFWRYWLNTNRSVMLTRVKLVQAVAIAAFLGFIYYGQKVDQDGVLNMNGALYMLVLEASFRNAYTVLNTVSTELPIFLKENRLAMYSTDVFLSCKIIAELPILYLTMIIFTAIMYHMVGLNPDPEVFARAVAIILSISTASICFGYMASCVGGTFEISVLVVQLLMTPFMLFGGYFMNVRTIPASLEWLASLSWMKYGFELLAINQWAGVTNITCTTVLSTCPSSGEVILDTYSFSKDNFTVDWLILIGLWVLFSAVAYFALLARTRYK